MAPKLPPRWNKPDITKMIGYSSLGLFRFIRLNVPDALYLLKNDLKVVTFGVLIKIDTKSDVKVSGFVVYGHLRNRF